MNMPYTYVRRLTLLSLLGAGALLAASAGAGPAIGEDSGPIVIARNGADNPPSDVRRGRGADNPPGDVRHGRGADNAPGDVRQGRGVDNPAGDVRRGRGADNPPGDKRRGGGKDDPLNHA